MFKFNLTWNWLIKLPKKNDIAISAYRNSKWWRFSQGTSKLIAQDLKEQNSFYIYKWNLQVLGNIFEYQKLGNAEWPTRVDNYFQPLGWSKIKHNQFLTFPWKG